MRESCASFKGANGLMLNTVEASIPLLPINEVLKYAICNRDFLKMSGHRSLTLLHLQVGRETSILIPLPIDNPNEKAFEYGENEIVSSCNE